MKTRVSLRYFLNDCRTIDYHCNCRGRENFHLQNQRLAPNLIFKAGAENDVNRDIRIYFDFKKHHSKSGSKTTRNILVINNIKKRRIMKIYVITKRLANI